MRCSKCGGDNREGRKFCAACGAPLVVACPKCGATNQPGERFCGECGTAFGDGALAATPPHAAPIAASAGGERRHLTVLFCDLVGSTEIAARLDPEEWRETVAAYHRASAEAVTRYGGHVAQYLGDGVMAFFGYPEAHDNDAERAARAGLELIDVISKLNQQSGTGFSLSSPVRLTARVGIDSGAVVVGAGAGKDVDVFGESPNIAARVQAAAEPDTVLITEAVHRLVSGLFVVESRGAPALKGIERPLQLYRVVQPSGVRGRLEAAAAVRGLTPFVGREDELRLLNNRWERALEGEGQMVLVIGEAGIGKSRLLRHFHEQVSASYNWLEAAGAPFFQNTPFHAIAELLRQLVGYASLPVTDAGAARATTGDGEAHLETNERLAQLEFALLLAGLKPAEAIPLIALLLNLPASAKYPSLPIPPEQQRRRLLAMLVEWVLGAARAQPLTIVLEDLHWADASTLEVIQLLAEQGPAAHLLLCTARSEFHPQWPLRAHHTQINLNRLSARNVREMIAQVAARDALAGETVDTVIERTGGVPLFVEELTRAVLENGGAKLAGREIPVTLHDSLMARLDRLGPAKDVIQIGAVIGGEFSYELLRAVHPVGEEELQNALSSATDAELIYVRGIAPVATYQFKHALIRDAAYEALLKSRRKELHGRIAEISMRQFPEGVTSAPELVAHHYTEASLIEQAIPHWQRAGQRAAERSANIEAISHFTRGLELLKSAPESPERIQQELGLQMALGGSLMAINGYGAPDVGQAYARAMELCRQLGETPQLFSVMFALATFNMMRGELGTAQELAERLLRLGQSVRKPALLESAHHMMGEILFRLGELPHSRIHLEQAIVLNDPTRRNRFLNWKVAYLGLVAITLWLLGYADQALQRVRESLALAREVGHPYSLANALGMAGSLYPLRREVEATKEQAEELIALSHEHGFVLWEAVGFSLRGWALAKQGWREEGITQIRQGLAATEATGTKAFQSGFFMLLAETCQEAGQPEEGLKALTEVFELARRTGITDYEPELHRLKGALLLMQDEFDTGQAVRCFQRAIEVARKQCAKSLELRATASLAHLLAQQGRRDEARTMLAEIYNWFTEGFDTADLIEAKALLDELAI